jgi:hypothetical protein
MHKGKLVGIKEREGERGGHLPLHGDCDGTLWVHLHIYIEIFVLE